MYLELSYDYDLYHIYFWFSSWKLLKTERHMKTRNARQNLKIGYRRPIFNCLLIGVNAINLMLTKKYIENQLNISKNEMVVKNIFFSNKNVQIYTIISKCPTNTVIHFQNLSKLFKYPDSFIYFSTWSGVAAKCGFKHKISVVSHNNTSIIKSFLSFNESLKLLLKKFLVFFSFLFSFLHLTWQGWRIM